MLSLCCWVHDDIVLICNCICQAVNYLIDLLLKHWRTYWQTKRKEVVSEEAKWGDNGCQLLSFFRQWDLKKRVLQVDPRVNAGSFKRGKNIFWFKQGSSGVTIGVAQTLESTRCSMLRSIKLFSLLLIASRMPKAIGRALQNTGDHCIRFW